MTTASTSAVISNASSTTFQAWVNEIFTNLVTNCGLSQVPPAMDAGQMAAPCVTALPGAGSTMAGYYMFFFNDSFSKGPVSTVAALTAGTGYNGGAAGTFTGVTLAGGLGTGAKGTVVLGAAGVVSSITITTAGTGYSLADQLTVTSANMVAAGAAAGGGSSGFAFVNALTNAAQPCLIKFEAGTGSAVANPQMAITIGTSWTSAGVVGAATSGAVTTRASVLNGVAISSTSTPWTSRYCYNTTLGFLGMVFKIGGVSGGTVNSALGGFLIFRTSDNAGSATANAMILITAANAFANNGVSIANGFMQAMSYTNGAIFPTSLASSNGWISMPSSGGPSLLMGESTTIVGALPANIFPIYTIDPAWRLSACVATSLIGDFSLGTTTVTALIGATTRTYLQVGFLFGGNGFAGYNFAQPVGVAMLWQ